MIARGIVHDRSPKPRRRELPHLLEKPAPFAAWDPDAGLALEQEGDEASRMSHVSRVGPAEAHEVFPFLDN